METFLITYSGNKNTVKAEAGGYTIVSKAATKCLGVMIDVKLSFKEHLEY